VWTASQDMAGMHHSVNSTVRLSASFQVGQSRVLQVGGVGLRMPQATTLEPQDDFPCATCATKPFLILNTRHKVGQNHGGASSTE
jgi:hypothetical protein